MAFGWISLLEGWIQRGRVPGWHPKRSEALISSNTTFQCILIINSLHWELHLDNWEWKTAFWECPGKGSWDLQGRDNTEIKN